MELTTTNQIIKRLVKRQGQYHKTSFIRFLHVDVQNVEPIDFTGMKYDRNKHEKCMFMFLDSELRIIGFLMGNQHDEKFCQYESYSNYDKIAKNRKQMTEKAEIILMFTPEMRKWEPRSYLREYAPMPKKDNKTYQVELEARLAKYKKSKHDSVSFEQVSVMAKEVMTTLVNAAFDNNQEIISRAVRVSGWSDREHGFDSIRHFNDECKNLMSRYEELQRTLERYPDDKFSIKHSTAYYDSAKIKIITWYNSIIKNQISETPQAS
jgi:hypothetical protein